MKKLFNVLTLALVFVFVFSTVAFAEGAESKTVSQSQVSLFEHNDFVSNLKAQANQMGLELTLGFGSLNSMGNFFVFDVPPGINRLSEHTPINITTYSDVDVLIQFVNFVFDSAGRNLQVGFVVTDSYVREALVAAGLYGYFNAGVENATISNAKNNFLPNLDQNSFEYAQALQMINEAQTNEVGARAISPTAFNHITVIINNTNYHRGSGIIGGNTFVTANFSSMFGIMVGSFSPGLNWVGLATHFPSSGTQYVRFGFHAQLFVGTDDPNFIQVRLSF